MHAAGHLLEGMLRCDGITVLVAAFYRSQDGDACCRSAWAERYLSGGARRDP